MKEKFNIFCCQLACIAIDGAHLMWAWREFYKEYSNIEILWWIFLKVPIIAILAIITLNTSEYVQKTLNLKT